MAREHADCTNETKELSGKSDHIPQQQQQHLLANAQSVADFFEPAMASSATQGLISEDLTAYNT